MRGQPGPSCESHPIKSHINPTASPRPQPGAGACFQLLGNPLNFPILGDSKHEDMERFGKGGVRSRPLGAAGGLGLAALFMCKGKKEGEGRGKRNRAYLLLRDVKLISLQNHITVLPDFPKNAFPAKFPHPADLLGLRRLLVSILVALTQREREGNGEEKRG